VASALNEIVKNRSWGAILDAILNEKSFPVKEEVKEGIMSNVKDGNGNASKAHIHGSDCGCDENVHAKAHMRELPDFPTEIIFKAVFRNIPFVRESIVQLCAESGLSATVTERASRHSTFISLTVCAVFPSDEVLQMICSRIEKLEGFMMMF